jgi:hypothetical protein
MLPLPSFLKADSLKSAAAKVSGALRFPKIPDDNRTMVAETARNVGKFIREKPFAAIFVASVAVHGLIWATLPNPFSKQAQTQNQNTPKPTATADPTKLPVVTLPRTNSRDLNRRRANRGNPLAGLPFLNNLPGILNPNARRFGPNMGPNMGLNGNSTTIANGFPSITGSSDFPLDQMPPIGASGNYPTGLPLNLGDLGSVPPIETSRDDLASNSSPSRPNRVVTPPANSGANNNRVVASDDQGGKDNLIDNRADNRSTPTINRPNNSNLRPEINPNAISGSETFFNDGVANTKAPLPRKNPVAQSPVTTPQVNTPEPTDGTSSTPPEEIISSWDVLYANISNQLNNQVTLGQVAPKEEQVANVAVEPVTWIPVANAPKGKKGVVEVALLITPEGKVKKQFLKSSGDAQLDDVVRQTIKGYYDKFQPAADKKPDNKSEPKHRLIRIRYLFS